jgi:hypothetical protein
MTINTKGVPCLEQWKTYECLSYLSDDGVRRQLRLDERSRIH